MLTCLGNVEETLVPTRVGSFMSSQDANDRCLSHGLGSDLRGTLKSGSVEGPSSFMAHQPSADVGCISCSQEFPRKSQGPPWARQLRQHIGGLLHKLPGGFAVMSTCKLACQICVCHILAIHWGLKIRNDRSVQETEQYLYIFFTSDPPHGYRQEPQGLIWFCLCMFFLSLKAVSPFDSNYKSDRLQRFESKIVVCVLLKKQSLGCPCGKQINIKLTFWVNYPFKKNGNELFN